MTAVFIGKSLRHRVGAALWTLALAVPVSVACVAAPTGAQAQASRAVAPAPVVRPATLQPLVEAAEQIDALLARGETEAALAAARQFLRSVTERTGFTVANARLTVAPAEGFGMYQPRPDSVFEIGEPVYAYVEVNGFSLTPQSGGVNRMLFDVSFTLDSPDGRQMTDSLISMGEVRIDSHSQLLDAYIYLTYSVSGAEGPFLLRTQVIDRASGQMAQFVLPVEFRAAPASRERK